jgi:uncharacterized membrane protein
MAQPDSGKTNLSLPLRLMRSILLGFCLLYLTIYLPIAGVLYLPLWYSANCQWHDRCHMFGELRSAARISELAAYMRHTAGQLESADWTTKEKRHLAEVRQIFDHLFLIALGAAGLGIYLFNAKSLRRGALANIGILFCLCGILPFFGYFWRDIFHEWLFDNPYWKNNPSDVSYYIMPRVFFKNTMILVIGISALINTAIFLALTHRRKTWLNTL